MTTRAEHLQWCKDRALAELDNQNLDELWAFAKALASFASDILKWEGGEVVDPDLFKLMYTDAIRFRFAEPDKRAALREWINGFN